MTKTLLFDLDGTLIENSMDTFLPPYFKALTQKLGGLVDPQKFIAQLKASTEVMMRNNDPQRTNAQVFADDFFTRSGLAREQVMPLFDDFYAREYRDLRAFVTPIELSRKIVQHAFERKYTVAIATAPLFPRAAIEQRLQWGNLGDFAYALITDYETMHASKPNPAYYREIATRLQVDPGECVMIGNEVPMDIIPARRVGMKTFWITSAGAMPTDVATDWRGTLTDLKRLLDNGAL